MKVYKFKKHFNSITELMGFIFQEIEGILMIKGFYKYLRILNKIRIDIFSISEKLLVFENLLIL